MRFPINAFNKRYPNDDACLAEIMRQRYGSMKECPQCGKAKKYHRVNGRRCYECQWCGHQLYPTKGTIFEKTSVSLKSQFLVMYMMTATRSGVAAKEVERMLDISYNTAWKLCHRVRRIMGQTSGKLCGHIEVDETYVGGIYPGVCGRGALGKTPLFGIVQRGGEARTFVTRDVRQKALQLLIQKNVAKGATISSDRFRSYKGLKERGYTHGVVKHCQKEYVHGIHHTQTIEGYWSRLKLSIHGTHVHVSKKHLQKYADEFSFRFNHRYEPEMMFDRLLGRVVTHA